MCMVCDGFVGNVTLKTMEGVVRMFLSLLKSQGEGEKKVLVDEVVGRLVTKATDKALRPPQPRPV